LGFEFQSHLRFEQDIQSILLLADRSLERQVLRLERRTCKGNSDNQGQCRTESEEHDSDPRSFMPGHEIGVIEPANTESQAGRTIIGLLEIL
jgi:hypothetical protein